MSRSRDVKTYEMGTPIAEYCRVARRDTSTLILQGLGSVTALLIGAGLALIGLEAYSGTVAFRNRDQTVRTFLDGITETRRGRDTAIRRDTIDGIVHSVGRRRYRVEPNEIHLLTLILTDGTHIRYSDASLDGIEELAGTVKRAILHRELPRIATALRNGETIAIGRIQLNLRGIALADKRISWSSLRNAREENGPYQFRSTVRGKVST